ncbi:AgrD family cyclic lactone autoinducer peptide [Kaarinaea lacus]
MFSLAKLVVNKNSNCLLQLYQPKVLRLQTNSLVNNSLLLYRS